MWGGAENENLARRRLPTWPLDPRQTSTTTGKIIGRRFSR
jgi:hypothetical protein